MNIDHPNILDILCNYQHAFLTRSYSQYWISSHNGIHGNSKADSAATSALQFEIEKFGAICMHEDDRNVLQF